MNHHWFDGFVMPHRAYYLSKLCMLGYSGFAIEVIEANGRRWWHSSASEVWLKRYTEAHAATDGIYLRSKEAVKPVSWVDLTNEGAVTPALLDEAASFENIHSGVSIPILAPQVRGFVEFFSPEKPNDQERRRHHEHMIRLTALAYDMFDRIVLTKANIPELTPRERECLKWSAVGKTNWEIGQILKLSEATVKEYLRNAARRLGVNNKTHAATRAIQLRLIDVGTL